MHVADSLLTFQCQRVHHGRGLQLAQSLRGGVEVVVGGLRVRGGRGVQAQRGRGRDVRRRRRVQAAEVRGAHRVVLGGQAKQGRLGGGGGGAAAVRHARGHAAIRHCIYDTVQSTQEKQFLNVHA